MPIKKSASKALRQAKKRQARNKKIKNNLKNLRRAFLKTIKAKQKKEAKIKYIALQKALDKTAKVGIIKKNAAARRKSQAAIKLNKLTLHLS
jgi:small subunit ribosomal protein S20